MAADDVAAMLCAVDDKFGAKNDKFDLKSRNDFHANRNLLSRVNTSSDERAADAARKERVDATHGQRVGRERGTCCGRVDGVKLRASGAEGRRGTDVRREKCGIKQMAHRRLSENEYTSRVLA